MQSFGIRSSIRLHRSFKARSRVWKPCKFWSKLLCKRICNKLLVFKNLINSYFRWSTVFVGALTGLKNSCKIRKHRKTKTVPSSAFRSTHFFPLQCRKNSYEYNEFLFFLFFFKHSSGRVVIVSIFPDFLRMLDFTSW